MTDPVPATKASEKYRSHCLAAVVSFTHAPFAGDSGTFVAAVPERIYGALEFKHVEVSSVANPNDTAALVITSTVDPACKP